LKKGSVGHVVGPAVNIANVTVRAASRSLALLLTMAKS